MSDRTIRLHGETWAALQALAYGFTGDDLGTPDKVIAKLIVDSDARFILDGLGCKTLYEAKQLVDAGRAALDDTLDEASWRRASLPAMRRLEPADEPNGDVADGDGFPPVVIAAAPRRDVHPLELLDEPDGVLESMANGDLDVTDKTRHLAQAELDYRRAQAQR